MNNSTTNTPADQAKAQIGDTIAVYEPARMPGMIGLFAVADTELVTIGVIRLAHSRPGVNPPTGVLTDAGILVTSECVARSDGLWWCRVDSGTIPPCYRQGAPE